MTSLSDNKYKENPPLDTVHKIRTILHRLGVTTVEQWTDSRVSGCYSLRVEIAGTEIGQNGKGTTPAFALASAYAELMERIQNDLIYTGEYDAEVWQHQGFFYATDERLMTVEELAGQKNPWVDIMLELLSDPVAEAARILAGNHDSSQRKVKSLQAWTFGKPAGCSHDFVTLPFYSLKTGELNDIPVSILRAVYLTNGTCAGNTREEALVQGLSEIFERNANLAFVKNQLTPAVVPDWYLEQFPRLYETISQVRSACGYQLTIKDCSLGTGFPVLASFLSDQKNQTYAVKFGAHPIFEIALERTLTELFQGRDLATAAAASRFSGGTTTASLQSNLHNILKTASGQYPESFFQQEATIPFSTFADLSGKSNAELLQHTASLILDRGHDLMIRDVSSLGFHSYQIVAPGFSEIFPENTRIRERRTLEKARKIMRNLPAASEEDLLSLVRLLEYKKDWILENTMEFTMGIPLHHSWIGGPFASYVLKALVHLSLGKYQDAHRMLHGIVEHAKTLKQDLDGRLACLRDYAGLLNRGIKHEEALSLLEQFHSKEVAAQIADSLAERKLLDRFYPRLRCFGCDECVVRGQCTYPVIRAFRMRMKEIQAEHPIDQKLSLEGVRAMVCKL